MKPLEGITVLDFSQFLSGPSAALRLGDLGAKVIKIENPNGGDICRTLYVSNCRIEGESTLFHAINRGKDGITLNLKDADSRPIIEKLIKSADVMIVNFRPGVTEKLGIDYSGIQNINPKIVYGEITGYGKKGPWANKPGQDLLLQAVSGLMHLGGDAEDAPMAFGLSVADLFAGQHLVQGILAALLRREKTKSGGYVHVSMLESILDIQFEVFTTYLNDGNELPVRSSINNANAYISAPYGIYQTLDGYIALAMVDITVLGKLISCPQLEGYTDPTSWATKRDEIKLIVKKHLKSETTEHWLSILEKADVWCSDVLTWKDLFETEGFKALDMIQKVRTENLTSIQTTRCPITIDGERYTNPQAAPSLGQHNNLYL